MNLPSGYHCGKCQSISTYAPGFERFECQACDRTTYWHDSISPGLLVNLMRDAKEMRPLPTSARDRWHAAILAHVGLIQRHHAATACMCLTQLGRDTMLALDAQAAATLLALPAVTAALNKAKLET